MANFISNRLAEDQDTYTPAFHTSFTLPLRAIGSQIIRTAIGCEQIGRRMPKKKHLCRPLNIRSARFTVSLFIFTADVVRSIDHFAGPSSQIDNPSIFLNMSMSYDKCLRGRLELLARDPDPTADFHRPLHGEQLDIKRGLLGDSVNRRGSQRAINLQRVERAVNQLSAIKPEVETIRNAKMAPTLPGVDPTKYRFPRLQHRAEIPANRSTPHYFCEI